MLDDIMEDKFCPVSRQREDWHYTNVIDLESKEYEYQCNDCGLRWKQSRIERYHYLMCELEKYTMSLFNKPIGKNEEMN